nr:PREDICTED: protein D3-like isoform X1 [Bemisia tabaci]
MFVSSSKLKWLVGVLRVMCGLLAVSYAGANIAGKLKIALLKHGIIPDIITQAPKFGIYIAFGKKMTAKFGNLLPIEAVDKPPTAIKWKAREDAVYTLIALDLNATPKAHQTDETESERLLWLVVNIPAPGSDAVKVAEGNTLAPYVPPSLDPIKEEDHRILFMVFEQPGGNKNFTFPVLDDDPNDARRNEFNAHKFIEEHKLVPPVAVNFYMTREGLLEAEETLSKKRSKGAEGVKGERFNPHEEEDEKEIEYI